MNKALLIGKLGGEPKTTNLENGKKVTKFSLATNEFFGDKKETTWHNIDVWGEYGVKMSTYLKTGTQIAVEGRISNNAYEKDGEKRIYSSIICDKIELLDAKKSNETASGNDYNQSEEVPTTKSNKTEPTRSTSASSNADDDLPF